MKIVTAALLAALLAAGPVVADGRPPEPDGYRTAGLRSTTPATLAGARVVTLADLESLVGAGAVLIDVGPSPARPETMPDDSVWLPVHRTVPGAVWLPGAGAGDLTPEQEARFLGRAAALAGGDLDRPLVVFCKPDCWASWNAGKRLVRAGHTAVAWFPDGIDAWQEKHATAPVDPEPGWPPDP